MAHLRLQYVDWPRPAVWLTDAPAPKCPDCQGRGGWTEDYGDYNTGEYAGTEHFHCTCWNPALALRVLPVPRWAARRWLGWTEPVYSTEPPF
ncbi:hypothetical protein ACFXDE_29325 [Kitasatospora sp. NPDC059408]|uniref:hypothetical protein n=1 Tax=Kitasatospora sp. NPDC059408 TaxID=3346823 RepID=UPI0036B03E1B